MRMRQVVENKINRKYKMKIEEQMAVHQYVMNRKGNARKRKAKELPQYDKNQVFMRGGKSLPQIIGAERLMRLNDILTARNAGDKASALLISHSAKAAWKSAFKRSRFYTNGASEKNVEKQQVKRVNPKLKALGWTQNDEAQLIALENANENGTGVTLELPRVYEMFLAARTAFIGGYHNTRTGKDLQPGLKAASSAASNELLRGLKEPQFEDVTKAEKWNANAWRLHLQGMNDVAQSVDISRLPKRDIVAKKLAEHRKRITSYWKSSGSKRWMSGRNSQFRLLREIIANALNGIAYNPKKDSAEHKAAKRLMQVLNTQLIASDMQRISEIRLDAIAD